MYMYTISLGRIYVHVCHCMRDLCTCMPLYEGFMYMYATVGGIYVHVCHSMRDLCTCIPLYEGFMYMIGTV